jgi:hypothetical protein
MEFMRYQAILDHPSYQCTGRQSLWTRRMTMANLPMYYNLRTSDRYDDSIFPSKTALEK